MAFHSIKAVDLKEKIERSSWTQEALAAYLGQDKDHFCKVVNGHRNISFPIALKIASMFGALTIEMDGMQFVIRPEAADEASDDVAGVVPLAGGRKKVRRPRNLGIPVKCMTVLREIGQLDQKLREIHECMLDVELGKPGAERRLITLVKEAQEAFFWIAVLLLHINERYPEVLDAGTAMAFDELRNQIGDGEADAA